MYVFMHYLPFRKQTKMKCVPLAMTEGSSCVCGAEGARRGGRTDLETLNVLSATKTLSRSVQTALTYSRKLSRRAVPVKSNSYLYTYVPQHIIMSMLPYTVHTFIFLTFYIIYLHVLIQYYSILTHISNIYVILCM